MLLARRVAHSLKPKKEIAKNCLLLNLEINSLIEVRLQSFLQQFSEAASRVWCNIKPADF